MRAGQRGRVEAIRSPSIAVCDHAERCRKAPAPAAALLAAGAPALDAVHAAVEALESDPLFNAGTGASLDARGELALDAALMCGRSLALGAVCALPALAHPIAGF